MILGRFDEVLHSGNMALTINQGKGLFLIFILLYLTYQPSFLFTVHLQNIILQQYHQYHNMTKWLKVS